MNRETDGSLTGGKKVLLVEDDYLVAEAYRTVIEKLGLTVMGPVATVGAALKLLEADLPDAALLDVNISGSSAAPIAERLLALDRPFVFLTGVGDLTHLPEHLWQVGILSKPATAAAVRQALVAMLVDRGPRGATNSS